MCGRYTIVADGREVAGYFQLADQPVIEARYNVAPTQTVPVVRLTPEGRQAAVLRWGLVPSWTKDPTRVNHTINARAETAAQKPVFRAAFRKRRCLVPATGFYEWKKEGRQRRPFFIQPDPPGLWAYAGLWETWHDADDALLETFTILTTAANDVVRPIHDRMPLVVSPADFELWLAPQADPEELQRLVASPVATAMTARPVSSYVNDVRHQGPECLAPAEKPSGQPSLFDAGS